MSRDADAQTTVALDPSAIRVLAHPVRSRLLSELRTEGPANATALARALDTNTGATSYHLRKLAEVGLVVETDDGQGRERWWRAAHDRHSWNATTVVDDPDARAASNWLEQEYVRRFAEIAHDWLQHAEKWSLDWRDAAGQSDFMLDLTPAELRSMKEELSAVVERYRTGDYGRAEDAERVFVYLHALPRPRGDAS